MALDQVASVAIILLLTVIVAAVLSYLLLVSVARKNNNNNDNDKSAGAAPTPRPEGHTLLPLPPSPWGLPLLGHLHLLGALPHRALASLARARGAPVLLLRLGCVPTVVVSSAAAAAEVMRSRDLEFASRPPSAMADRLLYGCRDVAFAPYGEYWRQARRVCVVHLLSARRVGSFRRVREHEAAALVARVRRDAAGAPADLSALLTEYANAVVSRAAFGDDCARGLFDDGEPGRRRREVFSDFQKLIGTSPVGEVLPWLGWVDAITGLEGKIRRTFEALDGLLEKVIDDHRRQPGGGDDDGDHWDFVDVLLDVQKNHEEYGIQLGSNEIKAILLDMFAAGTDTTTTVMEWAMAELISHPRAMRRAQDEVRAAAGCSPVGVSEDHVAQLEYLKAVVKETLRLHAPVPLLVPREPPADAEVLGYRVPARTRVMVNAWAIGRDPATWERAEEFVPERFLGSGGGGGVDFKGQHLELVPFGAGRRVCPGLGFAEASVKMALASLLYHFDWEVAGGGRKGSWSWSWNREGTAATPSLDMTEMNGIAVHIKSGLPLVAKPWVP